MRDFPVFTTQNGVASIVLREIPYRGEAYITLRDSLQPDALLAECVEFCKIAGAAKIYATGHNTLEKYPLYTSVMKMQQLRNNLPEGDGCLFPATEETAERWRSIYNEKMKSVPNASVMTREDMKKYISRGGCYFVHKGDRLLGIGLVWEDKIEAIASCVERAGETVLRTLCNAIFTELVTVEVASTNLPAIRLYERLGFQKVAEISCWYTVNK